MKKNAAVSIHHCHAGCRIENFFFEDAKARIDAIYKDHGIEFQTVFDEMLLELYGKIDYKILAAGIVSI